MQAITCLSLIRGKKVTGFWLDQGPGPAHCLDTQMRILTKGQGWVE